MSTSFTDAMRGLTWLRLGLAAAGAALLAGCASTPSGFDGPSAAVSRYADQRAGGIAADSDAIHVPPVPYEPAAAVMAEAALQDYAMALHAMRSGRDDEALALLQTLAERYTLLSGPWVNIGLIQLRRQQFADAEHSLHQALATNPRNPYAHNALGRVLREQGRFDEAQAHYQQATELDPRYARAHFNLGVLAELYQQRPADALQHFRRYQALQKQPDQTVANWIADLERRVPAHPTEATELTP